MPRIVQGLFVEEADGPFIKKEFERRRLGDNDVDIDIKYAGVCGSDLAQVTNEWTNSDYSGPGMCPGHEIVGIVRAVGRDVTKFQVGDRAGIGCIVDSCRECVTCRRGDEQLCKKTMVGTYNDHYRFNHTSEDGAQTFGGYSTGIVCLEDFVVHVPESIDFAAAAPLLCAGVTTYAPLRHFGLEEGMNFAVAGFGGLGHMAVQFAVSMGANVTVLSRGTSKREAAMELGAHDFVDVTDESEVASAADSFDFILSTIPFKYNLGMYISLLREDGKLVNVGMAFPPTDLFLPQLIMGRKTVAGSVIGSIAETQETLDYCAEHNIVPQVEVISADYINEAYKRFKESDVRFRFVIDTETLEE